MNRLTYGLLFKQIHDELEKCLNNSLRSRDLTLAQVGILMELRYTPEKQMSLKELERCFHVAQSTAAGIVSRLEQKGFVESFGSADDRRIKMVRITSAGEQCCQFADQHLKQTEDTLLSELTETEQSILLALLQKICASLK